MSTGRDRLRRRAAPQRGGFPIASSTDVTQYEITCPRCKVTFPPETRTCIHCGGPVGRRFTIGQRAEAPADVVRDDELDAESASGSNAIRWLVRSPLILLVIVFSILRACSGG